jgi:hypothetical protein
VPDVDPGVSVGVSPVVGPSVGPVVGPGVGPGVASAEGLMVVGAELTGLAGGLPHSLGAKVVEVPKWAPEVVASPEGLM